MNGSAIGSACNGPVSTDIDVSVSTDADSYVSTDADNYVSTRVIVRIDGQSVSGRNGEMQCL